MRYYGNSRHSFCAKICHDVGERYIYVRLDTGLDEKVVRKKYLNAGLKIWISLITTMGVLSHYLNWKYKKT